MTPSLSRSPAWHKLLAHRDDLGGKTARELWRADSARGSKLTVGCAGLALDFSKQPATEETLALLCALARERGLVESIEALAAKNAKAAESAPKEQKAAEEGGQPKTGKRKSRNRRHGHRKSGDKAAPAQGGSSADTTRSEP